MKTIDFTNTSSLYAPTTGLAVVDDTTLARGTYFGGVDLVPLDGDVQHLFRAHDKVVHGVAGMLDRLVTASEDTTCKIWDLTQKKAIHTAKFNLGIYSATTVSDTRVALGFGDGVVGVYDARGATLARSALLKGHLRVVRSIAPLNENLFATASYDSTVKVWDHRQQDCCMTFVGHTGEVYSVAKLDQNFIATGSSDKTAKEWNLRTRKCWSTSYLANEVFSVAVYQDKLVTGSREGQLARWDIDSTDMPTGHKDDIRHLVSMSDGRLASGTQKTIQIWP